MSNESIGKKFYYVDESGDPVLFNRRKELVVGKEGSSTYFMLGLLEVESPEALSQELELLRGRLLADPYFRSVPSMQKANKKTAVAFHAKDDIPEVRREVYELLLSHEVRFFAVVRDKRRIAKLVKEHNALQPTYRYSPNQLYDRCVARLFKERLHKDDAYRIVFAKRGRSDRSAALMNALENARQSMRRSWGIEARAPIEVVASTPPRDASLQAVDYFLWALQRLFERHDSRYWDFVWPRVSLVHDIDDMQNNDYGEYYSQRKVLDLAACQKRSPGI